MSFIAVSKVAVAGEYLRQVFCAQIAGGEVIAPLYDIGVDVCGNARLLGLRHYAQLQCEYIRRLRAGGIVGAHTVVIYIVKAGAKAHLHGLHTFFILAVAGDACHLLHKTGVIVIEAAGHILPGGYAGYWGAAVEAVRSDPPSRRKGCMAMPRSELRYRYSVHLRKPS